jgi:hypothetical protein
LSVENERIRYMFCHTSSHTVNRRSGAVLDQLEAFDLSRTALGFRDIGSGLLIGNSGVGTSVVEE